jgi:S-layer protein
MGAIAIDGTTTTTSASVTQTRGVTVQNYAAGTATTYVVNGVAGVTNSAVTVRDATAIAGTAAASAGTLTTVTLSSYGNSTISSNVLSTLNLSGTGGTLGITTGLTTPTNRTLALNLNATTNQDQVGGTYLAGNTITDSTAASGLGYTTINITNTGSSRLTGIAAVDTTAVSLAGSGTLTVGTLNTMTALSTVTVTGSAGLSSTGAFASTVTSINASGTSGAMTLNLTGLETATDFTGYSGGSGVDTITIATAPTKSITGGSGSADVIVVNATTDIVTGNANVSGFEILRIAGAAATGTFSGNGFTGLQVGALNGAVTFNNVAAGTALTYLVSPTQNTTYTLTNSAGTTDSVTINLTTGSTSSNALIATGTITTTGVETINIVMTDTPTSATTGLQQGRNAALVNTMTLADATATTINVSGNAGLTLTNAALEKVSSFNASGVVIGTALAAGVVTYTSATTKANSLTTTITGGAGADVLTGGVTADTIAGGAGNDTLGGGLGADSIDGGIGTNTVSFASITTGAEGEGVGSGSISGVVVNLGSTAVTAATINTAMGGTVGISGSLTSVASGTAAYIFPTQNVAFSTVVDTLTNIQNITGTGGTDYIVGSTADNTIIGGNGVDVMTGGTGADTFSVQIAEADLDVITDFSSADFLSIVVGTPAANTYFEGAVAGVAVTDEIVVLTAAGYANVAAAYDAGTFAAATEVTVIFFDTDTNTAKVAYDANGETANDAVELANLTGITSLALLAAAFASGSVIYS